MDREVLKLTFIRPHVSNSVWTDGVVYWNNSRKKFMLLRSKHETHQNLPTEIFDTKQFLPYTFLMS